MLVGFVVYPDFSQCRCLLDNADFDAVNLDDYPFPTGANSGGDYTGTGKVNSTDGDTVLSCYRNDVSLLCLEKTSCS